MPSMLTSVAFSVFQVSVVDCPWLMELGLAEMDAVGAGGGGGGACGVTGAGFLPQPATNTSMNKLTNEMTERNDLNRASFIYCSPLAGLGPRLRNKCTEIANNLFKTPVGLKVASLISELPYLRAVGEHGPYLCTTAAADLEDDVAAVRRPRWIIAHPQLMGELHPALGSDVHHVDVLSAGSTRAIVAAPREGEELPVRRPRRRDGVTTVSHALQVGAIGVHDVDLRKPGAAAHERNL